MAATVLSQGTTISIKSGASFVKINGVISIDGLGSGSASVIDATDLDSVAKEKQQGLADEGQITINVNYIPTDAGQTACDTARSAQTVADWQIVKGTTQWTFKGFVPKFDKNFGVDKLLGGAIAVEITGAVTKGTTA